LNISKLICILWLLTIIIVLSRQKPYLTLWLKLLVNFALMLTMCCLSPIRYSFYSKSLSAAIVASYI